MVFIVVFAIIAIIVIGLNFKDSSNLDKIEEYFKKQNCSSLIYSKGSYKGFCDDYIMQIPNSFNVNINEDKRTIKLNKIKKINKKGLTIILNEDYKIEFKEEKNLDSFYNKLEGKLK